ncbi:MAG: Aminotransferase, DegT/DnrJ/EryC1/StrS family [Candidatus Methanosuratincola subterraneus]|uniref:Aminotransferase, DegT/DnrJ/EryC1/StrS family n=1 Tax=Methanosuratincola subterraneus TaxID=2593994 RepID=A0A3S3S7T7_METS7|nr:MAG: Aminotransferase, DegT/DnrJ/EryC1/StrS family [Candidatus Methanosuratincola subterraneus]
MIPINKPILGKEEIKAVAKVIESGALTNPAPEGGSVCRAFEQELASYCNAKHAVACNSGTAALQMALMAAGVGPGDEVIVPSFTFVATASSVLLVGARPVFVDIDPDTYNMDPEQFRRAITPRTKAVVPVDLYGLPAAMDEIKEIARQSGIIVIEDACQAQGASYKGKMAGTLGDMGCFSFYPGKVMTTGEGGAVITDDDELAERLRRIRTHGQVKGYDSVMLGGNFRMTEMAAAMGRVQLKRLPGFLSARERNATLLLEMLDGSDLKLPEVPDGFRHNWYLFTAKCKTNKERESLKSSLLEAGFGVAVYYPIPLHRIPVLVEYSNHSLRISEEAAETVLSLPVNPVISYVNLEMMTNKIINHIKFKK